MNLFVSLTPSESKRLIGKAVAEMPIVKERMKKGKIAISVGSTGGFVAEEILKTKIELKKYVSGLITGGKPCRTPTSKLPTIFLEDGKVIDRGSFEDEFEDSKKYMLALGKDDLYIKSANAVDQDGNAGFLIAHMVGGNVVLFTVSSSTKRVPFIIPVGLEKLVPSVIAAAKAVKGQDGYDYSFGRACGFHVVTDGIVVTEIEAIDILFGAKAVHVASGGIGGSEGSVVLSVEGTEEQIKSLYQLLKNIKGEPAVEGWKMDCKDCTKVCDYPG